VAKRRALGRGLDALLAGAPGAFEQDSGVGDELRALPVDLVERSPLQPRIRIDEQALAELADSIRARGIIQPIVVRPLPEGGRYELIAGERRWRASQLAGLEAIPALIKREVSDEAVLALALIENIQREDLNPIEQARAFRRLTDEFGLTHQAVADAVGRSRAAVTNYLRLLDLEADVRELLERGDLEMGHARALRALAGSSQCEAAREVVKRRLSVRETEALVRRCAGAAGAGPRPPAKVDPDLRRLENSLSDRLGAPVAIRHTAAGRGRLVIRYGSIDELEGILEKIR